MYIRRKVFSVLKDENGQEKYFSTTEFINEESYLSENMYSEESEKGNVALDEVVSHKGRGRTAAHIALLDPVTGIGAYAGRKAGKKAADKADKAGDSDEVIVEKAGKAGAKKGAAVAGGITAGAGALMTAGAAALAKKHGVKLNKKQIAGLIGATAGSAAVNAGIGAIGGRNSARVQTKARVNERAKKEREIRKHS